MEMRKEFKKLGVEVSFQAAINDVNQGISELNKLINTLRFMITENCGETKEQFRNYIMKGDKPDKIDDDLMDAIRYAIMGQRQFNLAILRRMIAPVKRELTAAEIRINQIFGKHREKDEFMKRA
jgi:hypothetical protein